jgi:hypothetical protein
MKTEGFEWEKRDYVRGDGFLWLCRYKGASIDVYIFKDESEDEYRMYADSKMHKRVYLPTLEEAQAVAQMLYLLGEK